MLIALEAAAIGVVAAGQTFVILTGGIDLSVEAMVSFSGVMAAILIAGTRVAGGQIANGIAVVAGHLDCRDGRRADRHVPGLADHQAEYEPLDRHAGLPQHPAGLSLVWTRGAGINIQKDPLLSFLTSALVIGTAPARSKSPCLSCSA